jgi:hypothetical protein
MTPLEKEQFCSLYYGQEVYHDTNFPNRKFVINGNTVQCISENGYLELKSLANISDEDAIECGYKNAENFKQFIAGEYNPPGYEHNDFFRSKGYAIPFRNYLVEDLVKQGVIKLI